MLDFDAPGGAVGRKIANVIFAENKWRWLFLGAVSDIGKLLYRDDTAITIKGRDALLRVTVKRIDIQRHAIIEQTEAAAHNRLLILERRPRQSDARRNPHRFGYALT